MCVPMNQFNSPVDVFGRKRILFLDRGLWVPAKKANLLRILKFQLKYPRTIVPLELKPACGSRYDSGLDVNCVRKLTNKMDRGVNNLALNWRGAIAVPTSFQQSKLVEFFGSGNLDTRANMI